MEKELIRKRIETYKKEMEEMLKKLQSDEIRGWEEKIIDKRYEKHIAVVEELEYILNQLENEEADNEEKAYDFNGEQVYETYCKRENGTWQFVGWGKMMNEEFCIETKQARGFIYKTYRWLTGKTEEYKYRV